MKLLPFFLLISSLTWAQSKKEMRKNKVKALAETITTIADGKETVRQDASYKFDKNGNITEEINYDKAGKMQFRKVSSFNNLDDKLEETVYDADGNQTERETYEYNSDGEKSGEAHYNEKNELVSKSVYSFNNKGLKTERKTFDTAGKLIQVKKYTYDF